MRERKAAAKTYLVEVLPMTKGPSPRSLSYFSAIRLAPGTLVRAPMRKGYVPAVVISSRDARSAKSDIRQNAFILRKLGQKDIYEAGLSTEFLLAAKDTAGYYAANTGAMLASLVPKMLLEEPENNFPIQAKARKTAEIGPKETYLLQMESEERFGQYRAMVRQCFARGASVMFVVPTHHDALRAHSYLSYGIAGYVYLFTLQEKRSDALKAWQMAARETHPILFITTPAGVSFNRPDLSTYIFERENSRAYRTLSFPYIHYKIFLESLARRTGRQLVLGDSVLSVETLWKEKRGDYGELSLVRWRLPGVPTVLVDATSKQDKHGEFRIISRELKALISKALDEKEKVLLFGARKGLAPTTVCGDCGFILPCLNCGAPVVLHRRNGETVYICHACGNRRESTTRCGYCGSWKLVALGIGTERIADEVRELFPKAKVEVLDKDYAPTERQARSIAKRFKDSGEILVATELAFFHVDKVPYSALASADSLFSIPDFGINERIFYLVSRLREMTSNESLVQTRNIGKQVLAWAAQGNIIDFYLNEIAEREALLYPPFSIFIKVSTSGARAKEDISSVKELFLKWQPDALKDSIILRIPREKWPDQELSLKLALLGPQFSVKVDPESIL